MHLAAKLRLDNRGFCAFDAQSSDRTCSHSGNAYSVTMGSPNRGSTVTIGPSWTRGLAVHAVGMFRPYPDLAKGNKVTDGLFSCWLYFLGVPHFAEHSPDCPAGRLASLVLLGAAYTHRIRH
jgi:hypothetical protein